MLTICCPRLEAETLGGLGKFSGHLGSNGFLETIQQICLLQYSEEKMKLTVEISH
jgi:hypothetical protein